MTTRAQEIVALFIEGKSVDELRGQFYWPPSQRIDGEEIEEILRRALKRHGRAKNVKRARK